jgi:glucose-6-phosphate isomerase
MAAGQHINSTEDRAVMHVALRAPKDKQLFVDGEDVVPAVHSVLSKVRVISMIFRRYSLIVRLLS